MAVIIPNICIFLLMCVPLISYGPSRGNTFVRIRGENLESRDSAMQQFALMILSVILSQDHEEITCIVPPLPAAHHHPRVYVGDQGGNATSSMHIKQRAWCLMLAPFAVAQLRLEGVALVGSGFIRLHFGGTMRTSGEGQRRTNIPGTGWRHSAYWKVQRCK